MHYQYSPSLLQIFVVMVLKVRKTGLFSYSFFISILGARIIFYYAIAIYLKTIKALKMF